MRDAILHGTNLSYTNFNPTDLSNADLTNALLYETNFTDCPTLHQAKGLDAIDHQGTSNLDTRTIRACVNHLPEIFLMGVGYGRQEIESLRSMYAERFPQIVQEEHRSVTFNLDVPEAFRVPCEQYLMYFVQFLHNFGVEVEADLKHSAGEVLFTL